MKKLGFALMGLLMISSTGAFAQMSFGVKAGLNFTNMNIKNSGDKDNDAKFKAGINAGAFADFELTDMLGAEVGMNFETKGSMKKFNEGKTKDIINVVYVTVPVDVKLTFGSLYVLAGPYASVAVMGKTKIKAKGDDDNFKESRDIEFGNEEGKSNMKRLDFGLGVGVGYELNDNLGVRAGYDLGLSNLEPGGDKKNSMKNGSINISATYKF
jgi:opacity protein-like surface antigen